MKITRALSAIGFFILAACASVPGDAPVSLAKRAYEVSDEELANMRSAPLEQAGLSEASGADASAPLPAHIMQQIDAARAQYVRGAAAYDAQLGNAQGAVRAGGGAAAGSEGWAQAQQAVSRLDAARGPCLAALGELDKLYVALSDQYGESAAQQINPLRSDVASAVERQNGQLRHLLTQLKS